MKEAYVSYEVAQLLKKKGFDEKFYFFYRTDDEVKNIHHAVIAQPLEYSKKIDDEVIAAPTQARAHAWLRENHNICITIYPDIENGYEAVLYDIENDVEIVLQSFGVYGIHIYREIYEDAVEAAIKYCLENLI